MVWCVGSFWPGFNDAILRAPLPAAFGPVRSNQRSMGGWIHRASNLGYHTGPVTVKMHYKTEFKWFFQSWLFLIKIETTKSCSVKKCNDYINADKNIFCRRAEKKTACFLLSHLMLCFSHAVSVAIMATSGMGWCSFFQFEQYRLLS